MALYDKGARVDIIVRLTPHPNPLLTGEGMTKTSFLHAKSSIREKGYKYEQNFNSNTCIQRKKHTS